MTMALFPFMEYWWFYAGFTAFVLFLLAVDLGIFHREAHDVSFREAAIWSAVWVTLSLGIISVVIAVSVMLSLWFPKGPPLPQTATPADP